MFADVTAAFRVRVVGHEAMAVQVAEEELIAIRRRKQAALINGESAVCMTTAKGVRIVVHHSRASGFVEADIGARIASIMGVVGDGLDILVSMRIEVLPGLPLIPTAGYNMVKMRNDAGSDEPLAMLVVIQPPRVTGAFGEDFKLMPQGMVTPHSSIDGNAFVLRRAWFADLAVREDPMAAVKPAVWAPNKAVKRFVSVLAAPAIQQGVGGEVEAGDFWTLIGLVRWIRLIISIFVWNKHQIR